MKKLKKAFISLKLIFNPFYWIMPEKYSNEWD